MSENRGNQLNIPSHVSFFRLHELEVDVIEDVLLALHLQRGVAVQLPDGVFVEGEALFERARPHRLVEHLAAGEVENSAVELLSGKEPKKLK